MFKNMKINLEKEYEELCEYSDDCYRKSKILANNTIESKFRNIQLMTAHLFIPVLISVSSLFPFIYPQYPLSLVTLGITMISATIGTSIQGIVTSYYKKKKNTFTSAKTNAQILEESLHFEIENKKTKNKQEIVSKIYDSVVCIEKVIEDYSDEISYINKYDGLSDEELKLKKDNLEKAYNERCQQLDILTTQQFLSKKFSSYRRKGLKIGNLFDGAMPICFFFSLVVGLPMGLEFAGNLESLADLWKYFAVCFSPILAIMPLYSIYSFKKNKDYVKAFNNLNNKLGKNSLPKFKNKEYEQGLSNAITDKIGEVVELGLNLNEIRSVYDTAVNKNKVDNVNDNTKEKVFEDTIPSYTYDEVLGEKSGMKMRNSRIKVRKRY